MKNKKYLLQGLLIAGVFSLIMFLNHADIADALSVFFTVQGGTGTTSPSGILYGDNSATNHLNTVTIGSNLTFSGGTLSATGGGSSGANPFISDTYAGVVVQSTTSPLWLKAISPFSLIASSTFATFATFNYSSSTIYSSFQAASSTRHDIGTLFLPPLATPPGAFLAVNPSGQVIATTTPSGGSGTVGAGTTGQFPFYNANGTTLTATSTLFISQAGNIGISSSSPSFPLSVIGNEYHQGKFFQFGDTPTRDTLYCNTSTYCIGFTGTDNTLFGVNVDVGNTSNGASAYATYNLLNDLADSTGTHYVALALTSSGYNDNSFGTGLNAKSQLQILDTDGPIAINASSTSMGYIAFLTGGAQTSHERMRITPAGNIGIGSATPVAENGLLQIGTTTSVSKVGGIMFGQDTAANLYRSAASTLMTDATSFKVNSSAGQYGSNSVIANSNSAYSVTGNRSASNGATNVIITRNITPTYTSGSSAVLTVSGGTYTPTSGTGTHIGIEVTDAVNQSGNSSGVTRGLYLNPTLTKAFDYRALETAPYTYNFNIATTTLIGNLLNPMTLATTSARTITNAVGTFIPTPPISSANVTISTSTALLIGGPMPTVTGATSTANGGVVTTAYGLQVFAPIGATTNIALQTIGRVFMPQITTATAGTNQMVCYSSTTGELIDETTTACAVSSAKFKHDITKLSLSNFSTIMALKPVTYSYNEDVSYDYQNKQYGFIAEEVAKVDPHLAEYGIDGNPRTLDDRGILAVIVDAVQKIIARLTGLEKKVADQQKQIDSLQVQINQLKK